MFLVTPFILSVQLFAVLKVGLINLKLETGEQYVLFSWMIGVRK